MKIKGLNLILLLFVSIVLTSGVACMDRFSNDFQKNWEELSKNVGKLNEYTLSNHNVTLKEIKVEKVDLDGAIFNGATFDQVQWDSVTAERSKFKSAVFNGCKFTNCRFFSANFIDVEFVNCEFINSTFLESNLANVKISNCKSIESEFDGITGTELLIKSSEFKTRSSFTDSKIPLKFEDTLLSGMNMMGLAGGSLTIDGGLLDGVNFGKSIFSEVILRRVTQRSGGVRFNNIVAKTISIEGVDMAEGLGFASAKAESLVVNDSRIGNIGLGKSMISKIYIRNSEVAYLSVNDAQMPHLAVSDSELYKLGLWDGYIDEFVVHNSRIEHVVGEAFKANTVVWHNVTLDGKVDLSNAQVKDFRSTLLKRGPDLQLITTGSNLQF